MTGTLLKKIDCVMYCVKDLEKAIQFYTEVFGLKIGWKDKEEEIVGLILPETDAEIVLHKDTTLPTPAISFHVENVEKFCRYYQKAGYNILLEPIEVRCGKYAELQDPEGNTIPIIDLTKFGGKPQSD